MTPKLRHDVDVLGLQREDHRDLVLEERVLDAVGDRGARPSSRRCGRSWRAPSGCRSRASTAPCRSSSSPSRRRSRRAGSIALSLSDDTSQGNAPVGASSSKRTVLSSTAVTAPVDSTPWNTSSAFVPFLGSASRLKVAATSFAVMATAVVELHALAELEGPHRRRRVRLPALREHGRELGLAVVERQVLADLPDQADGAVVAQGERVELARRRDGADPDRAAGRAALPAVWSRTSWSRRTAAGRDQRTRPTAATCRASAARRANSRRSMRSVHVLVDQVVLDLASARANDDPREMRWRCMSLSSTRCPRGAHRLATRAARRIAGLAEPARCEPPEPGRL